MIWILGPYRGLPGLYAQLVDPLWGEEPCEPRDLLGVPFYPPAPPRPLPPSRSSRYHPLVAQRCLGEWVEVVPTKKVGYASYPTHPPPTRWSSRSLLRLQRYQRGWKEGAWAAYAEHLPFGLGAAFCLRLNPQDHCPMAGCRAAAMIKYIGGTLSLFVTHRWVGAI